MIAEARAQSAEIRRTYPFTMGLRSPQADALDALADLAERQVAEIEQLKEEADAMSTQIYESLPKYEVNDLLATKDAENARLRGLLDAVAPKPGEAGHGE